MFRRMCLFQNPKEHSEPLTDHNSGAALLTAQPLSIDNRMLVTAHEERSVALEEYNKLRSTVISLTRGEVFLNTLLVTSVVSRMKERRLLPLILQSPSLKNRIILFYSLILICVAPPYTNILGLNQNSGWLIASVMVCRLRKLWLKPELVN